VVEDVVESKVIENINSQAEIRLIINTRIGDSGRGGGGRTSPNRRIEII